MLMIGCGNMGQAMLSRWLEMRVLPSPVTVIKPTPLKDLPLVQWLHSLETYEGEPSIVVLAVKPQMIPSILPAIMHKFGVTPLYVTVAAGLRLETYQTALGQNARVIRAMPNTPVAMGAGVTTLIATDNITTAERGATDRLFAALGHVHWLEHETQMNAATALAGSGPAYAYLFMDALAEAGIAYGLPPILARHLAIQTLCGAAQMANASSHSLSELRHHVTSKGGTTEAALQQLMKNDALSVLVASAVAAAIARGEALNIPNPPI